MNQPVNFSQQPIMQNTPIDSSVLNSLFKHKSFLWLLISMSIHSLLILGSVFSLSALLAFAGGSGLESAIVSYASSILTGVMVVISLSTLLPAIGIAIIYFTSSGSAPHKACRAGVMLIKIGSVISLVLWSIVTLSLSLTTLGLMSGTQKNRRC